MNPGRLAPAAVTGDEGGPGVLFVDADAGVLVQAMPLDLAYLAAPGWAISSLCGAMRRRRCP